MIRQPITPEIVTHRPKLASGPPSLARSSAQDLIDVEKLADWLDTKFEIPGLGIRFGVDAILGLIPGFGDMITAVASLYILGAANRHGVPRITQARMAANIAVDWLAGSVPLAGDAFDVFWKANRMNVALLQRHLASAPHERRRHAARDWFFLALLVTMLLGVLAVAVSIAYFAIAGIAHWIFS